MQANHNPHRPESEMISLETALHPGPSQEQTNSGASLATVSHAPTDGPARKPTVVPARSVETVNPFTRAASPAATQMRDRLRAMNLFLTVAVSMLVILAAVRLWHASPANPTTAGTAVRVQLVCIILWGSLVVVLTYVRRPGPRLLVWGQWLTVMGGCIFSCYFAAEKLFDDINGSMTLFLRHHPAFAAVAFAFGPCAFILAYGVLIPIPWRQCAAQTGLVIVSPVVLTIVIGLTWSEYGILLFGPFLWVLFAALGFCYGVVVYSAYTVSKLKEDVIRAKRVGQYRLLDKLGEGGMGVVYRAEHCLLKRPCAVKLIRPRHADSETGLARFEREVRAMAGLSHWNAVDVYDYGVTEQGLFYYVMELLKGLSARQLVDKYGPLPPARVVYLLRQVCAALSEAHERGLVHRDVTPANVFVAEVGGQFDVVKLLDFGLVYDATNQFDGGTLTQEGVVMGTPGFMSYEQAAGARYLDCRSDLYSVGAVGFFLLTGHRPFTGVSAMQVLASQLRGEYLSLRELYPDCPEALAEVIQRCLRRQPEERFASSAELEAALIAAVPENWTAADAALWWKSCEKRN